MVIFYDLVKWFTNMTSQLGKIPNIEELKSYGSLKSIKESIFSESGIALRANSWEALYEKLSELVKNASKNQSYIEQLANKNISIKDFGNFNESKSKLSDLIGYKLSAKSWDELHAKTDKVISACPKTLKHLKTAACSPI